MPQTDGLRNLKKARTRRHIAATAAQLFAQRGYEDVTVGDVARASEVATQTVYNYFPTKASLVTDRDEAVQARLSALIRERAPGTNPAAAIRAMVLDGIAAIPEIPPDQWSGEIGHLALISATVHRLSLEMTDRQATVAAQAILDTTDVTAAVAQIQGMALASVFQLVFAECGRRTRDGQPQQRIADELTEVMTDVLDELERWFDARASSSETRRRRPPAEQ